MSPNPRLFVVKAEITVLREAIYYVYAHNEMLAEEKLIDVLGEQVERGQNATVITDDVTFGDFNMKDIGLLGFEVGTATRKEEETK